MAQVVSAEPGFRDVEEAAVLDQGAGQSSGALLDIQPAATEEERGLASSSADWWEGGGVKVGHATHRVWVIAAVVACLRCGAYLTGEARRAYKLHAPCGGAPPNPSAALRLSRLRRGHHPLGDLFMDLPRLSRVEGELRVLDKAALVQDGTASAPALRPAEGRGTMGPGDYARRWQCGSSGALAFRGRHCRALWA